jgi:glycosyltransferase involved in cell wall biosynthesis
MSLITQIVVKNNEKTIKKCLDSIESLNGKILILDIGSNDNSIDICEEFGVEIRKQSLNNDYSKLRNENIPKADWFLWIQPWEELVCGHEEINIISSQIDYKKCFDFKTINKKIISRETRFWNVDLNIEFKNKIFESPSYSNCLLADNVVLNQNMSQHDFEELKTICSQWKKEKPLLAEPIYYEAYLMLLSGKYKQFCHTAEHYLFNDRKDMSDILMRYNLAQVQIYQQKEFNAGVGNVLSCLIYNPAIAEFWCLLGDAFYQLKEMHKAIIFYENAIIAGETRELDSFPIDVSKYKDYPIKMIENCEEIMSQTKRYIKMQDPIH